VVHVSHRSFLRHVFRSNFHQIRIWLSRWRVFKTLRWLFLSEKKIKMHCSRVYVSSTSQGRVKSGSGGLSCFLLRVREANAATKDSGLNGITIARLKEKVFIYLFICLFVCLFVCLFFSASEIQFHHHTITHACAFSLEQGNFPPPSYS
jgi:hypothetical protein